jgi:hypothetical protein
LTSKPVVTVCEWFGLKTTRTVLPVWSQNRWRRFLSVWPQKPAAAFFAGLASKPVTMVFSNLTSKLVVTISPGLSLKLMMSFLVEPQNQGGGPFLGLGLKTGSSSLMI